VCLQEEERSSNGSKYQRNTGSNLGAGVWWGDSSACPRSPSGNGGLDGGSSWEDAAGRAAVSWVLLARGQVVRGLGGIGLEHGESLLRSRIDGTDHTSLTMFTLGAVEPDWLVIFDRDGESWHDRGVLGYWHKTGVETGSAITRWGIFDWNTRVGKGSSDDGMVHRVELELDEITDGGLDLLWVESRLSVLDQSLDDVDFDGFRGRSTGCGGALGRSKSGEGSESNESLGEQHFD
jgi:hypothetical protein